MTAPLPPSQPAWSYRRSARSIQGGYGNVPDANAAFSSTTNPGLARSAGTPSLHAGGSSASAATGFLPGPPNDQTTHTGPTAPGVTRRPSRTEVPVRIAWPCLGLSVACAGQPAIRDVAAAAVAGDGSTSRPVTPAERRLPVHSSRALSMRFRATWRYEASASSRTSFQSTGPASRSRVSQPLGPKYGGE